MAEKSLAMMVSEQLKEQAEDYKKVAKEYKKQMKTWKIVALVFIAISLAISTYTLFLLDSLNDDIGLIQHEVEDLYDQN